MFVAAEIQRRGGSGARNGVYGQAGQAQGRGGSGALRQPPLR